MEPHSSHAAAASRWVFVALAVSSVLFAAGRGDLSGTWKLNREASDNPKQKVEDAAKNSQPTIPGGGRGHGMHHGGGPRPSEGSRSEREAGPTYDTGNLMKGLDALTVVHQDPKLLITDSLGHEHVLYTDGRKIEEQSSSRGTTKVRAQWMDGHVVVKWEAERGPTITETYSVTADGKQLTVFMRLEGKGRMHEVTIKRVYDAISPEPEQPHQSPAVASPGGRPERGD